MSIDWAVHIGTAFFAVAKRLRSETAMVGAPRKARPKERAVRISNHGIPFSFGGLTVFTMELIASWAWDVAKPSAV